MKKKLNYLSIIVAILMLLLMCGATKSSASENLYISEDFAWTYRKYEKGIKIVEPQDYQGTKLVIPQKIDGYNVIGIEDYALVNAEFLEEVTIPKTITDIGHEIFKNKNSITIKCYPASSALDYAFSNDIKYSLLTKVNIKTDKNLDPYVNTSNRTYTGRGITPQPYLEYEYWWKDSLEDEHNTCIGLEKGKDYTVSYKNNKKVGTATIVITGKGNYTGTVTKTFKIVPKKVAVSSVKNVRKKSVKVNWKRNSSVDGYEVYMAKKVLDKYNMKTTTRLVLRESPSTSGKSIETLPKGTKLYIIKKNVKKANGYTWYKVIDKESFASGYVASKYLAKIYGPGKYTKIKTVKSNKTTTYKKAKLSKNATYYFKVRNYKIVNGKKYYSYFSSVKSIKIKK